MTIGASGLFISSQDPDITLELCMKVDNADTFASYFVVLLALCFEAYRICREDCVQS